MATLSYQKLQDRLMNENCKEIEKVYGKERLNCSNVGWGMEDTKISSKVYGNREEPTMIVTTSINPSTDKISHCHEEY
jgi:hypothetical protein